MERREGERMTERKEGEVVRKSSQSSSLPLIHPHYLPPSFLCHPHYLSHSFLSVILTISLPPSSQSSSLPLSLLPLSHPHYLSPLS
jgi:hypothetical protein